MLSKRDDIITAALTAFREDGLKGARMERIAQQASVSKRTLYKYFKNKDELFAAICELVIKILAEMEIPAFDPKSDFESQLTRALGAYIDQTLTPEFLNCSRVILPEFMRKPATAQKFNKAYYGIDGPLSQFIQGAMNAGRLKQANPDAATALLLALFKSTVLMPSILNGVGSSAQARISETIDDSVQVFMAGYAVGNA